MCRGRERGREFDAVFEQWCQGASGRACRTADATGDEREKARGLESNFIGDGAQTRQSAIACFGLISRSPILSRWIWHRGSQRLCPPPQEETPARRAFGCERIGSESGMG